MKQWSILVSSHLSCYLTKPSVSIWSTFYQKIRRSMYGSAASSSWVVGSTIFFETASGDIRTNRANWPTVGQPKNWSSSTKGVSSEKKGNLKVFTMFYQVLLCFTMFYYVLLRFSMFYYVLLCFTRFLLGFTRFYKHSLCLCDLTSL